MRCLLCLFYVSFILVYFDLDIEIKSANAFPLLIVISESREAKKPDFETKIESLKGRQYKRSEQEGFHWPMAQVSNSGETKS